VFAADPVVTEGVVDRPVSEVWRLWTTQAGLQSWMVKRADIDLRIGGLMRTRYADDGPLGDSQTINNRILSYEPERMLSIKVDGAPADFPFRAAIANMWTVIYFNPLDKDRTSIRIISLGFDDSAESRAMREFFVKGNAMTLEQLKQKSAQTRASGK
jgi:uncharacterized protein YndB with AHSA1/START domain